MAVVWIVENPAQISSTMAGQVCGIAAVRAFATIRSLLRVSACDPVPAGATPRVILIDESLLPARTASALVARELVSTFSRNGWPEPAIVVAGAASPEAVEAPVAAVIDRKQASECVRQLLSLAQDPVGVLRQLREGNLLLDLDGCRVGCVACGKRESLSPTEVRLLRTLLEHKDRLVPRQEFVEMVWRGTKVASRTLDAHVSRLRKRIEFTGARIENSYGDGYTLLTDGGCEAARGRMAASRGGSTGVGRAARA